MKVRITNLNSPYYGDIYTVSGETRGGVEVTDQGRFFFNGEFEIIGGN